MAGFTYNTYTMVTSVLQTIDTQHEDVIHDSQMDYFGTHLATCSSDRTVKIFEVKNGTQRLIETLTGHEGPVWQVNWAHPKYGKMLASCSYDKKVIIWKEINGQWSKLYEYADHDSSVNSVCWAPHETGLILACASSDGSISILAHKGNDEWEATKIPDAHINGCLAVSWAPAVTPGSLIEAPTEGRSNSFQKMIVSAGIDQLLKTWKEDQDGKWVTLDVLSGHNDWVRDCSWAPSVGLPKSKIASCSSDGRVIVWTSDQGSNWKSQCLHKFNECVWHVSWSLTGDLLAVSSGKNDVSLWKEGLDETWTRISDVVKDESVAE